MNKFFLNVVAGVLALFAMSTNAQAQTIFGRNLPDQQIVFGSQNVNHGEFAIYSRTEKLSISFIQLRIRECSSWKQTTTGQPALNASNFYLTSAQGQTWLGSLQLDGNEWVVTFSPNTVLAPNSAGIYTVIADLPQYQFSVGSDQECYRLDLDRSGLGTKVNFTDTFPIKLRRTIPVRSKPTVTITPLGATSGRIRTAVDDIALLRVTAAPTIGLYLKDLYFSAGGNAAAGGVDFKIIDAVSGEVVGMGVASGAVVWFSGYREVSSGQIKEFKVRINSTNIPNNLNVLSIQIANRCDFQWNTQFGNTDNSDLCLEPQVVPITSTISYE